MKICQKTTLLMGTPNIIIGDTKFLANQKSKIYLIPFGIKHEGVLVSGRETEMRVSNSERKL